MEISTSIKMERTGLVLCWVVIVLVFSSAQFRKRLSSTPLIFWILRVPSILRVLFLLVMFESLYVLDNYYIYSTRSSTYNTLYIMIQDLIGFVALVVIIGPVFPFRPVIVTCYSLSERAASKLVKEATGLAREGKGLVKAWQTRTFGFVLQKLRMMHNPLPHRIVLPSTLHGTASYETLVLDFVQQRQQTVVSSMLGISGMRGVGKTTLLRFVRDSYAPPHDFLSSSSYNKNDVFFLGAGTVVKLQYALAVNIGLGPPPQISEAAKMISSYLKGKPFLLLLDDVREKLDLAAVGLPMPLGHNQKVIFTTRDPGVCDEMGCTCTSSNTTIHMEPLGEDDAWSLFKDKVGDHIIDTAHPHIKHLATKMVAECRGLPSALCALGRSMSTKTDIKEWRYAYYMLKKSKRPRVCEIQDMDDQGYSHVHRLQDELLQHSAFF